ncbi:response regulator transcription factor [Vagococcus bubulae]|uniref:DNA-binding response regulator n=1 Tax=Vagococcus bubulae TaxID=1977868 RepID=A0A429ZPR9_9ENTE|nr:response regulator transcription factor [Vagococcus bubulae]RST95658.1 DNA-binding response regulator [Vagococcus bubulae]
MSHVLIIEDDESIASLQKDYLEINEFDVHVEHDGKKGLDEAINGEYDLVILDIMLPNMDGFEICKQIRLKKQIPIIMVSAKTEDIDKIRGLGLGADDYMIKPFSPNELVARVKAHLSRFTMLTNQSSTEKNVIKIDNVAIDSSARKVFINNEEVIFTTKEFSLLLFLVTHPNTVWSKEKLFEMIWEQDVFYSDVSTITVHIKRIREKLKQQGVQNFPIETVWGSGYRFNS